MGGTRAGGGVSARGPSSARGRLTASSAVAAACTTEREAEGVCVCVLCVWARGRGRAGFAGGVVVGRNAGVSDAPFLSPPRLSPPPPSTHTHVFCSAQTRAPPDRPPRTASRTGGRSRRPLSSAARAFFFSTTVSDAFSRFRLPFRPKKRTKTRACLPECGATKPRKTMNHPKNTPPLTFSHRATRAAWRRATAAVPPAAPPPPTGAYPPGRAWQRHHL